MKNKIFSADSAGLQWASQAILQGNVVAFPTETFYGLGAEAFNLQAIKKVFALKGREEKNPLLLLIADPSWLPGLVKKIPPLAETLMARFWPGPLTLIFESSPAVPPLLTAQTGKIGVRISSHPVAAALTLAVGRAITGTSANLSGQPSAQTASEVWESLGPRIEGVLNGGKTPGGRGSTVLDVSGTVPQIVRQGAISREALAPYIGEE
jgi:L-threonylcarbamoyladenylate synthase